MAKRTLVTCDNCGEEMTNGMDENLIEWREVTPDDEVEVEETTLTFDIHSVSHVRRNCNTTDLCDVCYGRAINAMLSTLNIKTSMEIH